MAKNRSAAGITNIVQYDANRNITFVSGSTTLLTVSSSGALTTSGTITATTLVVQTVTSSVNFVTGSTKFGSLIGNTHQFTGSINVTGSLAVVTNGTEFQVTSTGVRIGNIITDSHPITGSVNISGSTSFVGSVNLGSIANSADTALLNIKQSSTAYTNGIYLERGGERNGYHIYIGGALDALTFRRNYFGTQSDVMSLTRDGNVGIGTTSPSELLDIRGAFRDYSSGEFNQIIYTTTAQSPGRGGSIGLGGVFTGTSVVSFGAVVGAKENGTDNNTAGYLGFLTRANAGPITEKMRINSTGEVGIGMTASSGNRFMVRGSSTSNADTTFLAQNSAGTNLFYLRNDGYINAGNTFNNTTSNAANVSISSSGFLERSTSSLKYKKDVRDYDKGLAEVMAMRPVYYKGISESDGDKQYAGLIAEEIHDLGLTEFVQYAEDDTPDALAYQNMVALLTKAIQELKAQNDSLQQQINELKA